VPEPLVIAFQRGIAGAQLGQLADALDGISDGIDGTGDEFEDRRRGIADYGADPLDQNRVRLADQHQRERADDQKQKGETLRPRLDRRCETRNRT